MKAYPLISSFNGGELSPLLGGRPDAEKYQAGLSLCENFIPRVQGALIRRGGTRYVAETKDSADRSWLVRFEFSVSDAFVLEFGDGYIRFYKGRGVYEDTPGHTYEVTTVVGGDPIPWSLADLTDADGSLALRYVQSADVIYFAHPLHPPHKLTRVANNDWRLEPLPFRAGPFKDQNIDKAVTVTASAATGSGITLTATSGHAIFQPDHVGSFFYLEQNDSGGIKPWFAHSFCNNSSSITVGAKCVSDGKYYTCTATGAAPRAGQITGTVKPEHTEGRYWDGDGLDDLTDHIYAEIGVEWEYNHSGYGWVQITAVAVDGESCTADVVSLLPDQVVTAGSYRWAHAAWSDVEGWPSCVTFFRQRLTFARDQRLWFSVAGDYENFAARPFDQIEPDSAMNLLIASARGDTIQWLAPVDRLLVGTGGTVFAIGESTTTQPFGPVGPNARSEDQALTGSAGVQPVVVPGAVVVVEKAGRILNEIAYDASANKYGELDLTVFAEHMTLSGIIDATFVKQPHSMICCALADGSLRAFTYMKAQGVSGWHRHPLGGSGAVESVVSIPSPDGRRDDLWMIVKRTIDGATKRYVEYLSSEYQDGDDPALIAYADASILYSGGALSTLPDLDHLEGCTVSIKADGASHPDRVVTGGEVVLERSCTKAVVGLPAAARARLMPLEAGGGVGSSQGKPKRVNRLMARLYNSQGGRFGPDFTTMEAVEYRTPGDAMDAALPLFTGDKVVEFPGDYDGAATIALLCDQEFPFTLVAMAPEVTTYDN
ncbi:MAG: hypothetical protein JWP35_4671 [Caulobacter sp.]|nr:hypothetical protein [Caulobacter sp.]